MLLVLIITLSFRIILLTRDVAGAKARCANPSPNKNLLVMLINSEHVKDTYIMVQVRKLTSKEMTCDLANSQQSSHLGVRLQPSKSQVDFSLFNNLFN